MKRIFLYVGYFTAIVGMSLALAQEPAPPPATVKPSQYPIGATPIFASANAAASLNTATLAAAAGKTTFICGASFTGTGATTAGVVNATITGPTVTLNYSFPVPAIATVTGAQPLTLTFFPCLPAAAVNTAVAVALPSLGAGNTAAAVSAQGYQL